MWLGQEGQYLLAFRWLVICLRYLLCPDPSPFPQTIASGCSIQTPIHHHHHLNPYLKRPLKRPQRRHMERAEDVREKERARLLELPINQLDGSKVVKLDKKPNPSSRRIQTYRSWKKKSQNPQAAYANGHERQLTSHQPSLGPGGYPRPCRTRLQ